ncbi:MAG: hypothetical protein U1F61_25835 [Opitutaceae bacterium]
MISRRSFLKGVACVPPFFGALHAAQRAIPTAEPKEESSSDATKVARDWKAWEGKMKAVADSRACDTETGEELGWMVAPFLEGCYYGYQVTKDSRWVAHLFDWMEACTRRLVREPDGFSGWPKRVSGAEAQPVLYSDNMLGEAMLLRPVVLMAAEVLGETSLSVKWGGQASRALELAKEMHDKWTSRGCWRELSKGGVWVAPDFLLNPQTNAWTSNYTRRMSEGFTHPSNKQCHIARWYLAMHRVTGNDVYLDRATKWFQVLKGRMRPAAKNRRPVWNYWDPAGPWDYKPGGEPRHWVGVHPNGQYYTIDVCGIVDAHEHGVVFDRTDIVRLVETNRDSMWNRKVVGASFARLDGEPADERWPHTAGLLWWPLAPYDKTLLTVLEANLDPQAWESLYVVPWLWMKLNRPAP